MKQMNSSDTFDREIYKTKKRKDNAAERDSECHCAGNEGTVIRRRKKYMIAEKFLLLPFSACFIGYTTLSRWSFSYLADNQRPEKSWLYKNLT